MVCVFTYRCKCGKRKQQHESRSNNQSEDEDVEAGEVWDSNAHTRRLDAISYGGITFSYDSLDETDGNWQLVSNDFSQVINVYTYMMQPNIMKLPTIEIGAGCTCCQLKYIRD